jgi:Ni/Fe-hydrogenase subunit HybB-like protein
VLGLCGEGCEGGVALFSAAYIFIGQNYKTFPRQLVFGSLRFIEALKVVALLGEAGDLFDKETIITASIFAVA